MSVNQNAKLEITAFDWVPDFARGYVRDLRPRWACEEIGLDYAEHLISAINRPTDHFLFQPWGQVPVLNDGGIRLFESGAILLHLAEKDARLMPRDPQARANTLAWLFAAYNSVEPMLFELGNVDIFSAAAVAGLSRPLPRPPRLPARDGRAVGRLQRRSGSTRRLKSPPTPKERQDDLCRRICGRGADRQQGSLSQARCRRRALVQGVRRRAHGRMLGRRCARRQGQRLQGRGPGQAR